MYDEEDGWIATASIVDVAGGLVVVTVLAFYAVVDLALVQNVRGETESETDHTELERRR